MQLNNSDVQQTIASDVSISGVGIHSGQTVDVNLRPAEPNTGIVFKRVDLPGTPSVKADVDNVVDTTRSTTIEANGARVGTIEHLMAALVGNGVDNVVVEINAAEVPILDGSAEPFIEIIQKAGVQKQDAAKIYYTLQHNITFADEVKKVEMVAMPYDSYRINTLIDFNSPVLGTQHAALKNLADFNNEVAPCRTFCFFHELEYLIDNNLIKGGDINNAIVVVDKPVTDAQVNHIAKAFKKENVKVAEGGILNNLELRFPNEPARHKLLDVIGDLALVGYPFKAHIIANRPGHSSNIEFAKKIKEHIKKNKHKLQIPSYDPRVPPLYDVHAIEKKLPHRYPFLLIDKVIELTPKYVIAIKNVTYNEPYFQGHFPGNCVMPGVLQVEALAQTGGILTIPDDPDNDYDTYFLKIDHCKFKQKVVPGDTLILKMELMNPVRRGICEMKGTIFVGDKIAAEAEMVAQIVKKPKEKSMISPLASIHPAAKLGSNVTVEPFAVIHDNVTIGDDTHIMSGAVIMPFSTIGRHCRIFPGAVIGAIPQDLKFIGEETTAEIGDHTTIRECVTINRGTKDKWKTVVGSHCLLMAYAHVAHDCTIGDHVILANGVQLAGHVDIGEYAIIGGLAGAHQFTRIGAHTYVAGHTVIRKDVPPYVKAAREPMSYLGLNIVGLQRRAFPQDKIDAISQIYHTLFVGNHSVTTAIERIKDKIPDSETKAEILQFILSSKTGIIKRYSKNSVDED